MLVEKRTSAFTEVFNLIDQICKKKTGYNFEMTIDDLVYNEKKIAFR